jgi:hypothetical protein
MSQVSLGVKLAKFRADTNEVRYYPTLGITVAPEEIVDLPDSTDAAGLTLIDSKTAKAVKAEPAADAAVVEGE